MSIMRVVLALLLLLVLAGCVSVAKIETGEHAVGERMSVTLDSAWNKISVPGQGPEESWTMEGMWVDKLLFYSGIKNDQLMHAEPRTVGSGPPPKSYRFKSTMQPDEIVSMFEAKEINIAVTGGETQGAWKIFGARHLATVSIDAWR